MTESFPILIKKRNNYGRLLIILGLAYLLLSPLIIGITDITSYLFNPIPWIPIIIGTVWVFTAKNKKIIINKDGILATEFYSEPIKFEHIDNIYESSGNFNHRDKCLFIEGHTLPEESKIPNYAFQRKKQSIKIDGKNIEGYKLAEIRFMTRKRAEILSLARSALLSHRRE